jgi:hypothetical protein
LSDLLARFWCEVSGHVEPERDQASIEIGPPGIGFGGPVRPRQARPTDLPPQYGDSVAEHQQLGGHRGLPARDLRQPAEHPNRGQVQQPN